MICFKKLRNDGSSLSKCFTFYGITTCASLPTSPLISQLVTSVFCLLKFVQEMKDIFHDSCLLFDCVTNCRKCCQLTFLTGGSLYLFNRRVTRFFRKDGHNWRKKRDGRTVGEAHERLKVFEHFVLGCPSILRHLFSFCSS